RAAQAVRARADRAGRGHLTQSSGRPARRSRGEFERDAVHAVALAGRLRAVVEDVAEMSAAAAAVHLGARNDHAVIVRRTHGALDRRVEARPAGTAVEFGLRLVERQVAGGALEHAGAMLVVERARERTFRAVLAQHLELRRREQAAPLVLAVGDLESLL